MYILVQKAPGPDNVTNTIIKYLKHSLTKQLTIIFNSCITHNHYPESWKTANITMIYKKNDHKDPNNYRPISLISNLGKILESIIKDKLYKIAENNNIIPNTQSGFRKNKSTNDQLFKISQTLAQNKNRKKQTDLILIDFEKCFDKVWIDAPFYKLFLLKFPNYLIKIIESFLKNRKNLVKIKKTYSTHFIPQNGLPQGSCISPILFLIFACDIPMPNSNNIILSQFADDIAIYSTIIKQKNIKDFQKYINDIAEWCEFWKLKINNKKTIKMSFHTKAKTKSSYSINNNIITEAQNGTFLGVTLDSKLTLELHTNSIKQKCYPRLQLLNSINNNKNININTKRKIYLSLIRSIIEYAPSFTLCAHQTKIEKLEKIQKKCIKQILNLRPNHNTTDALRRIKLPSIKDEQMV